MYWMWGQRSAYRDRSMSAPNCRPTPQGLSGRQVSQTSGFLVLLIAGAMGSSWGCEDHEGSWEDLPPFPDSPCSPACSDPLPLPSLPIGATIPLDPHTGEPLCPSSWDDRRAVCESNDCPAGQVCAFYEDCGSDGRSACTGTCTWSCDSSSACPYVCYADEERCSGRLSPGVCAVPTASDQTDPLGYCEYGSQIAIPESCVGARFP